MKYILIIVAVLNMTKSEEIPLKLSAIIRNSYDLYGKTNDIIQLTYPFNNINRAHTNLYNKIFFVEAVLDADRTTVKEYKGAYYFLEGTSKKILDNATCVSAAKDYTAFVYIGTPNGIYVYDNVKDTTTKYGTLDDNIKDIVKLNYFEELYIVTKDNKVYKVTNKGTKKTAIENVDAEQIAIDKDDNLYFYGKDKQPYVLTETGKIKFEDLPQLNDVMLYKTAPHGYVGTLFSVNNNMYLLQSNGSVCLDDQALDVKPTGLILDSPEFKFVAKEHVIYEYIVPEETY